MIADTNIHAQNNSWTHSRNVCICMYICVPRVSGVVQIKISILFGRVTFKQAGERITILQHAATWWIDVFQLLLDMVRCIGGSRTTERLHVANKAVCCSDAWQGGSFSACCNCHVNAWLAWSFHDGYTRKTPISERNTWLWNSTNPTCGPHEQKSHPCFCNRESLWVGIFPILHLDTHTHALLSANHVAFFVQTPRNPRFILVMRREWERKVLITRLHNTLSRDTW